MNFRISWNPLLSKYVCENGLKDKVRHVAENIKIAGEGTFIQKKVQAPVHCFLYLTSSFYITQNKITSSN